jgi:hypothetical protein
LHLSPEDIAAAEACGVSFLPASDAQVQRLAMQRKVFYRAGAPILATRGDGFFETAGTLQQLIEQVRQQERDLSQWLEAAEPAVPEALPEPVAALAEPAPLAQQPATTEAAAKAALPSPKRPRQKRRRPEPPAPEEAFEPGAPEPMAGPLPEAEAGWEEVAVAALPAAASRPASRSPGRKAARAPAAAAETPGQDRGKRWLMAGAARRGRAGKHWSTRQR